MRPRHLILTRDGTYAKFTFVDHEILCQLGDYDLLIRGPDDTVFQFWAVVCSAELRKPGCWNAVEVHLDKGNLIFTDDHVQPDPYHLCLIYQAIEAYEKGQKE